MLSLCSLFWMLEDYTKRSDYQMARFVDINPGKGDVARLVILTTAKRTLRRSVLQMMVFVLNLGLSMLELKIKIEELLNCKYALI